MESLVKLKINKKFQPFIVDEKDELFPNGFFEFNITKLIAQIKTNPDDFPIEEVTLDSLWESSPNLSETTIQAANLSVPIILAEISPGRFNVVDGNHRVAKARRDGVGSLPAFKVGPDQHHHFLTTVDGYKKYVEYWNSKVVEMSPSTPMKKVGFRKNDIEYRELTTTADLAKGFQVLRELRTHISFERFLELDNAARRADRYTVVGAFEAGQCIAVMGYRVLFDLVHGKHLYVDDLVVTERCRSKGVGAALLREAETVAQRMNCDGLRLCTGIENEAGKRFYEREGWELRSVAYKKKKMEPTLVRP